MKSPLRSNSGSMVVFDGDNIANGGSWTEARNKDLDSVTVAIDPTEGFKSSQSLKASFSGDSYMGLGWNWKNLWAAGQGDDVSAYENFKLDVKVSGDSLPDANNITFQLAGAGETSDSTRSKAFAASRLSSLSITDGEWHTITIPIAILAGTLSDNVKKDEQFDPRYARELSIGINPKKYLDFDIHVDNLRFE